MLEQGEMRWTPKDSAVPKRHQNAGQDLKRLRKCLEPGWHCWIRGALGSVEVGCRKTHRVTLPAYPVVGKYGISA